MKLSNKILQSSTSNFLCIKMTSPKHLLIKQSSIKRLPIFSKSKSISKSIKFITKPSGASNNSIKSSRRKSQVNYSFDNSIEEINLKEIYKKNDDNIMPKLIQKFIQIEECSILKYGLKPSTEEIEFSFCRGSN